MKKIICSILLILVMIIMIGIISETSIINKEKKYIEKGYYDMTEYSKGEFQDYTDYNKYYYKAKYDKKFEENKYYTKVTKDNIEELTNCIIKFSTWMESEQDIYDFDMNQITEGDFFHQTKDKNTKEYDYINIYYYDIETHTLYYFYSNL